MLLASWRPSIKSLLIIGTCLLFNSLLVCNSASARGKVTKAISKKTSNQHQKTKNPAIEFTLPTVLATSGEGSPQESITNNLRFRDLVNLTRTSKTMRSIVNPPLEKRKEPISIRHAELRDQILGPNSKPFENILSYIDQPKDIGVLMLTNKPIATGIVDYRKTPGGSVHFQQLEVKLAPKYLQKWQQRQTSLTTKTVGTIDRVFKVFGANVSLTKVWATLTPPNVRAIEAWTIISQGEKGHEFWDQLSYKQKTQLYDQYGIEPLINKLQPHQLGEFLYKRWSRWDSREVFTGSFRPFYIEARRKDNPQFRKDWDAMPETTKTDIINIMNRLYKQFDPDNYLDYI